jgi:hypothetical protein
MLRALSFAYRTTMLLIVALIACAAWGNPGALALLFGSTALAVTSADLTTLDDGMKRMYVPMVAEQQNLAAVAYKEFADGDDGEPDVGGQGLYFTTHMGGNQEGIGSRSERDDLPAAGRQRYKQGFIKWFYDYGTVEITGPAIHAAKNNVQAFANLKTKEVQGITADKIKDYNRQVYGKGDAVLATVTADGPAANTFYVDDPMYLRKNMMIDVWNANVNAIDSRQITDITLDGTGWYVTYDGADVAAANGWLVIREDNASLVGGVRTPKEIEGLQKIIDDGTVASTYLNISRTANPLWNGHVLDNGGAKRNITEDLLFEAEDRIVRATGESWDYLRTGLGQKRKYFDICKGDRRYMTGVFDAGYERLDFNGRKITIDIDCPKGKWFMAQKRQIKKAVLRPFGVLDEDGKVLRQVAGKDLWRMHIGQYWNLYSLHGNACAIIADLNEPTQSEWIS